MNKTEIEIIDEVLGKIKWMRVPAYRRFYARFGDRKARILRDYVIFPLFGIKTIRQLERKVPYRIEEVYEVLKLGYDWRKLVIAIARDILKEIISEYNKLPEEKKIRIKITLSTDDTYDPKSGKKMEGTAIINDHHDGIVKILYNPVIIYCTVDWNGEKFCFPLDLQLWRQEKKAGRKKNIGKSKKRKKAKAKKKPNPNHKKRWQYAYQMLASLLEYCDKNNISLRGFEFTSDNAYCVKEMFELIEDTGLIFVTRPCRRNSFKIKGKSDSLYYFGREMKGHKWKISRKHQIRYVKCKAKHLLYGDCTILFYQYLSSARPVIYFLIANTHDIRADSLFAAFKRRWPIEVFFRNLKQVLAFSNYSGRKLKAVKAHYLLRMLTAILTELIIQFISNDHRWPNFFPNSHITYGDLQTFIIEHYGFSDLL